jgi:hypothetical protein
MPKTASVHKKADQYNYRHFTSKHFLGDLKRSAQGYGRPPGSDAPDFELESTDGDLYRLGDFRGRPILLHFGAFT